MQHSLRVFYNLLCQHCTRSTEVMQPSAWTKSINFQHSKCQKPIQEYKQISAYTIYNITYNVLIYSASRTFVWKHECNAVRNGCLADSASMRRSVIVHSTSSSSMIMCFFSTFTANSSFVDLCSPSSTYKQAVHLSKSFTAPCHQWSIIMWYAPVLFNFSTAKTTVSPGCCQ